MGGTHEVFLPFLSPIFKTIRATTTRYLPIGARHATRFRNETILCQKDDKRGNKLHSLSKNNGRGKWDRSQNDFCPTCLFRTKHLVFLRRLFFSRIVKNSASQKEQPLQKAMIPPTKRLGPASPNLPKKIGLGLNNLYPQTLRMLTVDHPRLVK